MELLPSAQRLLFFLQEEYSNFYQIQQILATVLGERPSCSPS